MGHGTLVAILTDANLAAQGVLRQIRDINVAADFPTLADVRDGWVFTITTDVTDNDGTKTNTGLSFKADDEIFWDEQADPNATWVPLGSSVVPPHTHVAGDITNFESAVAANTDVAANTAAQHTLSYETFTLTAPQIAAKEVLLAGTPLVPGNTVLYVNVGPKQIFGTDFTHTAAPDTITWSALALDGILTAGDILEVYYEV